jgi:ribosome-associated toxin RatA of RatAB toxin-antitoxin module
MKKIISADTCILKYEPELIFDAISDVTVYDKWWSKNVKIKVLQYNDNRIGSKVEVHALGGWFRCEIVSTSPPNEVRIKYYEGVQKGLGIWTIEKTGDNKSILTYSIDLEPVGLFPGFLSHIMNFSKIHSKRMEEMFESLDTFLETRQKLTQLKP